MKKLLGSVVLAFVMMFGGVFLTGCNEVNITANFKGSEIVIEMGKDYSPFDFIEQSLSADEKAQVEFKTENPAVAYVDTDKKLSAVNYGVTTLYAVVGGKQIASCPVSVPAPPIALDIPTNLKFDDEKGALTWNFVMYMLDGEVNTLQNYVLQVQKAGSELSEYDLVGKNEFVVEEAGTYTARVQAKAPTIGFSSSDFSYDYTFKIMAAPKGLAFNPNENVLSWQANGNAADTKYKVTYSISGAEEQEIFAESTSVLIPAEVVSGLSTFKVETVPEEFDVFKNVSETLEITKLADLEPVFNNGVLTWEGDEEATKYQVVVDDGVQKRTEFVTAPTSVFAKQVATVPGKYTVTVQAIGDVINNVYDSNKSVEIKFEKLPNAEVVYKQADKTFVVLNADMGVASFYLVPKSQGDTLGGKVASLKWTVTNDIAYGVKAQILASDPKTQIDGDEVNVYKVEGQNDELLAIQNLSGFSITYQELVNESDTLVAQIEYIEREQGCTYSIAINGEKKDLQAQNNAFALGEVSSLFSGVNLTNKYNVTASKTVQNQTFFVESQKSLTVSKIVAPSLITLENGKVKLVASDLPEGASGVEFSVNGVKTDVLSDDVTAWMIGAKYVAKTTSSTLTDGDETTIKFYSSSNQSMYAIERLAKPSNVTVDYVTKEIVFSGVLNAQKYNILADGAVIKEETGTKYKFGEYVGRLEVVAVPAEWQNLSVGATGYIESLPSEVEVVKIDDISDLKLTKVNGEISAVWTSPDAQGKTLTYTVYKKYIAPDADPEECLFAQVATGIETEKYTFDDHAFDAVGNYVVKVQVSSGADYLTTKTTQEVSLTRFEAPQALTKFENTLEVQGFDESSMTGISVQKTIDGMAGEKIEQASSIVMLDDLAEGQTLVLKIAFVDSFEEASQRYNLGSTENTFTITKLKQVEGLEFKGKEGATFTFAWTAGAGVLQSGNGYNYYTSNTSTPDFVKAAQIDVSELSGGAFEFYVKEAAPTWTEIRKDETKYISADNYVSVNVYKESSIENPTLRVEEDKVVLGWTYHPVSAYTIGENDYNPVINVRFASEGLQFIKNLKDAAVDFENGLYEFEIAKTKFDDAGEYKVNITVNGGTKTINSQSVDVTFNKLEKLEWLTVSGDQGTFVAKDEFLQMGAISTIGMQEIVETNGRVITGNAVDLSDIVAGNQVVLEVYKKAVLPTAGSFTFYLDSDKTKFTIARLAKQNLVLNVETNTLSWNKVDVVDVKYILDIQGASPMQWIENNTQISLAGEGGMGGIPGMLSVAGRNDVTVQSVAAEQTISAHTASVTPVAYLSSLPSDVTVIEKLGQVNGVKLSEVDGVVTISFNEVESLSGIEITYKIYQVDEYGQVIATETVPETTATTYNITSLLTQPKQNFAVQAFAKGAFSGAISQMVTVEKLTRVEGLTVGTDGLVQWSMNDYQTTLVTGGYVIEVRDSIGDLKASIELGNATITNFALMSDDALAEKAKEFIDGLDGKIFGVSVFAKGALDAAQTKLTIDSAKASVEVLRLAAPQIVVEKSTVSVVGQNPDTDTIIYLEISNGVDTVYTGQGPYKLSDSSDVSYTITAYATVNGTAVPAQDTLDSKFATKTVERLADVDASTMTMTAETDTKTMAQDKVTLTWQAVSGVDEYEVFVNGILQSPVVQASENPQFVFEKGEFAGAGEYRIAVRALAATGLNSNMSAEVKVVRLSQMKGSYLTQDGVLVFGSAAQQTSDYTLFANRKAANDDIVGTTGKLANSVTEYEGFAADLLKDTFSGSIYFDIRYVGGGELKNGVITLSSKVATLNAFKFEAPTIKIYADRMTVDYGAGVEVPGFNQSLVEHVAMSSLTITHLNEVAVDDAGSLMQDLDDVEIVYPQVWAAGEYTFSAKVQPKNDIYNLMPSKVASVKVTRLAAPENVGFKRDALGEEATKYTRDDDTTVFKNQQFSLVFDAVTNALGYVISDNKTSYNKTLDKTTVVVNDVNAADNGEFESFIYGVYNAPNPPAIEPEVPEDGGETGDGSQTPDDGMGAGQMPPYEEFDPNEKQSNLINIVAVGDGENYINSAKMPFSYKILNNVDMFMTDGEIFKWSVTQTGGQGYLITVNYNNNQKYWQSDDMDCTESTLANLEFENSVTLNIKVLGNITETGLSAGETEYLLDSRFLESNRKFEKLAKIYDLATKQGLFTFKKIDGAQRYTAIVTDEAGEMVIGDPIEIMDFAGNLALNEAEENFIGYSAPIASLEAGKKYKIQVRAEASGYNTLNAEFSEPMTASVLPRVNDGAELRLESHPTGALDKRIINVTTSAEALGVWVVQDYRYTFTTAQPGQTEYQILPVVNTSGAQTFAVAAGGTTAASDANEHILTSAFSTLTRTALDKVAISVANGIITWGSAMGADGYYVYINDVLVTAPDGTKLYPNTMLELDDSYATSGNNPIKIEVVPVVIAVNALWGPSTIYELVQVIESEEITYENQNFTVKLKAPEGAAVVNGSILWMNGVVGLDNASYSAWDFEALYSNIANSIAGSQFEAAKEAIDVFENALEGLFKSPITLYSKYSGFGSLMLSARLTDQSGKGYEFMVDAYTFLSITDEQLDSLTSLMALINGRFPALIEDVGEAGEALYKFGQAQQYQEFANYLAARLQVILNHFSVESSPNLARLIGCNDVTRFPSHGTLFEELATGATSSLPYGKFNLTLKQFGNTSDWLTSKFSAPQQFYVPSAPTNLKVVMTSDNDFHLIWNPVTDVKQNGLTYLALYDQGALGVSSDVVYAVYGETTRGIRKLITYTTGTKYGDSQLSLSLTDLIEEGLIDSNIAKIYMVAQGNAVGLADGTRILSGLKSQSINITVLPQATASFVDGVLNVLPALPEDQAAAFKNSFELSPLVKGAFNKEIISDTTWTGSALNAGSDYAIAIRYVGVKPAEGQLDNFVLSGKKLKFSVNKLAPMDVKVNEFGQFYWTKSTGAAGFMLAISGQENVIVNRDANVLIYETQTAGFRNYKFRALGTSASITSSDESSVFYLNSDANSSGYGIDAVMLSATNKVIVENGVIKWSEIDLMLPENQTTLAQDDILIIGYRLTFSNSQVIYTTELSKDETRKGDLFRDDAGNMCFDFTNYGEEGVHIVDVQAYAQVKGATTVGGTTTSEDGAEFTQLLGQKAELQFNKIAPPNNIRIMNGRIEWQGNENDKEYTYQFMASGMGYTGKTVEKNILADENVRSGTKYTFKVRAYAEGFVYSSYALFVDVANGGAVVEFEKIVFETPITNKTTEVDGNYISFTLPDSALSFGINIKYRANDDGGFSYLLYGDENYDNVVSINNNLVRINVTKLGEGIQTMEYYLQLVPLGETTYLCSDFTTLDRYNTPEKLDVVYFDEQTNEFYFEAKNHFAYSIRDQILDEESNVVATYYYQIPASEDITQVPYYKNRLVANNLTATFSFSPVVMGYTHVVAVATVAQGQEGLMSSYTTCTQTLVYNTFGVKTDVFDEESALYSASSAQAMAQYLQQNAYGTAANPYLVETVEQFASLNIRLEKYDYLSSYTVDVAGLDVEPIAVIETENTFTFKQTKDLSGISTVIGLKQSGSLGSVSFVPFNNTYDGAGFALTYELNVEDQSDYVALFRAVGEHGTVKNLKVRGNIVFNGAVMTAGLVAENRGLVENIVIETLNVDHFTLSASTFTNLVFGGVVATNYGTVKGAVNNAEELIVDINVSGMVVTFGAIVGSNQAGAVISQSGNNMKSSVWAMQEARVGGITGYNNGEVSQCYNKAQIEAVCDNSASSTYVGGLVGLNDTNGSVTESYVTGNVVAESMALNVYAGGVVGYTNNTNISFTYSESAPIVIATDQGGNAVKTGGTFIGYVNANSAQADTNYYAYEDCFGRADDKTRFTMQKIDVNLYNQITNMVSVLNTEIGEDVFRASQNKISLVWERA